MMHALKAEFRKLLSVRSTYVISLIVLAITALINFWIMGHKNAGNADMHTDALLSSLMATLNGIGIFVAIVAILMVGHEYRYNTIMYSLTAVNRRWKLLVAKYAMLVVFTLVLTTVMLLLGWALFYMGLASGHVTPTSQNVPIWPFMWRTAAYVWGSMTFAFIIAVILRNLIGAIVFVLIVPSTIEGILGMLLKENAKYLPYTSLGTLSGMVPDANYAASFMTVVAYVIVGGAAAYWLFTHRDAN